MKLLYDIFFIIFSLAYTPYLLIKGKWHKGFFQKFGILPEKIKEFDRPVWIHAVSLGEAVLAVKLAEAIKGKHGHISVIISTTTSTGNDVARKAEGTVADLVFYYPMDISFIVSRAVKLVNPRAYVMVETELWPNLLETLKAQKVPVMIVNGRISDNSFKNYRRIRFITKRVLGCIDALCMQTAGDAERVISLGADKTKVFVSGNIKFDEDISEASSGIDRESLGFKYDDKVIIAGSTHYPEEKGFIELFEQLKKKYTGLKLVIAPRHIERVPEVKKYAGRYNFQYNLFSEVMESSVKEKADILIIDTIGSLKDIYSLADIVFIGGSMAKKGGQNPIEAARWGKPIIFGPYMFNFREMSDIFLERGAAVRVMDTEELKDTISGLLSDSRKRSEMSGKAKEAIRDNQGALGKTLNLINKYFV